MLCRKKPSPARRRARKYTAVFLSVFILFTTYVELAVKTQLKDVILCDMRTLSQQAVTSAVDEYLSQHPDMAEKLCAIACDGGSVAAVSVNTPYVNTVKTAVTQRAQEIIDSLSHTSGVTARLGSFTGIVYLANTGPDISFTVDSTQTVSCDFTSAFESAGINQTVHHITMTVTVELLVYSPFRIAEPVRTESTFEIAQTVIVGSVPSYSGVVSY